MRLEVLAALGDHGEGEVKRDIGAVVARGTATKGVVLELGPADGPPHLRILLSRDEVARLSATLQAIAAAGGEAILIVDE